MSGSEVTILVRKFFCQYNAKGDQCPTSHVDTDAGAVRECEGIADLPLDGDRGTRSFDHRPAPAH